MPLQNPSRPMSVLIVCADQNEGAILRLGLVDALGPNLQCVEVFDDVKQGFSYFEKHHPDVVLALGLKSAYSEALTIRIRKHDAGRHTGVIILAPVTENFDRLAEDNFFAGADDVAFASMSTMILRSKIVTVFNLKMATDNLRSAVHKLHKMTLTDELTGLSNMRGFLKKFEQSLELNKLRGVSVVMMDLDHFKKVNDTMNHMVGSFLIKSVGQLLANSPLFGPDDYAARYGGDEFIFVTHGGTARSQIGLIDQIRKQICGSSFEFQGYKIKVTSSLGFCWVESGFCGKPENIVKAADAMLYRSKERGRNRVSGFQIPADGCIESFPDQYSIEPLFLQKKAS